MSKILDAKLAPLGAARCRWASDHMPALSRIVSSHFQSKPLRGVRVGFCLQLTAESAALILGAKKLGARVSASSGNPLTTDDAVAAYLASNGVNVYGWRGQTASEFSECADSVMFDAPDILSDDGGELGVRAHTVRRFSKMKILGGTEETTTGVRRFEAMQKSGMLRYPVVAVNDAETKRMFDNRYGTGQSTVDSLLRSCNLMLASKTAVVAGYGWVGRGVAERLAAMGCKVIVTEVNPTRALEAVMDGYEVMPMIHAARRGHIFVTCTGNSGVIARRHMDAMREGAILANAGHFDVEIDTKPLGRGFAVRPGVEQHTIRGKKLYLVSRGRVSNLAAAEGHPPEIMDLSFSNHLLCILYVRKNGSKMRPLMHTVPEKINRSVAHMALASSCVRIDSLNARQKEYAESYLGKP